MKITIVSPVKLDSSRQTGINIRIQGISKYLEKHGHRVILTDRYTPSILNRSEILYCLVSTKPDSITTQVIEDLKPNNKLILDLYTPILLEKDLTYIPYFPTYWVSRRNQIKIIKHAIKRAIFYTVANKRQKSYWLSQTKAWGIKIDKKNIAVIPTSHDFYMDKNKNGKVILWFGGIYPWLDPTPLAQAFSKIASNFPRWKLRILGGFYKGTGYNKIYKDFTKVLNNIPSNQLEIVPWQSPKKLPEYLKDVAFAVHLPKDTKEDLLAHRVRLLTLTNSHIPVLTSGKDEISKIIVKQKAGMCISQDSIKLSKELSATIINPKKILNMTKNTKKVEKTFVTKELADNIFQKQKKDIMLSILP